MKIKTHVQNILYHKNQSFSKQHITPQKGHVPKNPDHKTTRSADDHHKLITAKLHPVPESIDRKYYSKPATGH
jgi:hypothetical protein